jgi:protein-S-isoprenylcysteine O-methyltransferase Ste14
VFLNVGLAIAARVPERRDWRPLSVIFTLFTVLYSLALDLKPGVKLVPEWFAVGIQCFGISWQIYAKVSLGRAFGLLPGDRGVVETGAYRYVRHPIYAGYFTDHVGFFLANFNLRNLLIFALLYAVQVARALREEQLLAGQERYREYCRRVPYRFIPRVI